MFATKAITAFAATGTGGVGTTVSEMLLSVRLPYEIWNVFPLFVNVAPSGRFANWPVIGEDVAVFDKIENRVPAGKVPLPRSVNDKAAPFMVTPLATILSAAAVLLFSSNL